MATHVQFVLVDNGGTGNVTVVPSNNSNGVAEWLSAASRSQAYRVTASVRQSSATNRKYTIKLEVPKMETQAIGGVQLPISAWKATASLDLTVPVYATMDDASTIAKALAGLFKVGNPIATAIGSNAGFYG